MIVYFDTSAVIPLLVEEAGSATAGRLWDAAENVVTSRLTYAEARAALAQAHRSGQVRAGDLRDAVAGLEGLMEHVDLVEVGPSIVRRAGELAEAMALRGYDAIHLSSAESLDDPELVLATGDRTLLRAASGLGVATADPNGR